MFHALKDSLQHSKKRFNEFRVTVLILLVVILLQSLRIHKQRSSIMSKRAVSAFLSISPRQFYLIGHNLLLRLFLKKLKI